LTSSSSKCVYNAAKAKDRSHGQYQRLALVAPSCWHAIGRQQQ